MGRINPRKMRQWWQHVESYRSSGLTRKAYCERNQIKFSTFGYWCKKVKKSERSLDKPIEPAWIPLHVSEDHPSGIDMRVGKITLEIKPGFDKTLLVELLRTIGSLC